MRFFVLWLTLALAGAATAAASCDHELQFSLADLMASAGGIEAHMLALRQDAERTNLFRQDPPENVLLAKQVAGPDIGREWVLVFPNGTSARRGLPYGRFSEHSSRYTNFLVRPKEYRILTRVDGVISAVKFIAPNSGESAFASDALVTSDGRTVRRRLDSQGRISFTARNFKMTSAEVIARFEELVLEADPELRRAFRRNEDYFLAELFLEPEHFHAISPRHVVEVMDGRHRYLAPLGTLPPFAPLIWGAGEAPNDIIDARTGDLERVSHFEELTLTPSSYSRLVNELVQGFVHPEAARQALFALGPNSDGREVGYVQDRYFATHPLKEFVRLVAQRKVRIPPY